MNTPTLSNARYQKKSGRIEFELKFNTVLKTEEIDKKIEEYLNTLGYKETISNTERSYQRGSRFGTYYSTSPRNVRTVIHVEKQLDLNQIVIQMHVRTGTGIATQRDIDFWLIELNGIEQIFSSGFIDKRLSEYAAERAKWHSCSLVLGFILICIFAVNIFFWLVSFSCPC